MSDLSYTNKDGLTPATGTTNLDWTNRNGVSANAFNYHKDAASGAQGYAHGGYPEITGGTSPYTDTSYKTGEASWPNNFDLTSPIVVTSIAITTAPTKTAYSVGDTLDLTGMVVTASLSGGTGATKVVTDYTASPANGATLTAEDTKVTVTYEGKTAEQAITIN